MQQLFTAIGLDFETGGLNCTRHASTQVALQAIRLDTLETIDRYTAYIAPYDKQEIFEQAKRKVLKTRWELQLDFDSRQRMEYEQKALDYSGITMEILSSRGKEIQEVAGDIIDFTVRNTFSSRIKPILTGHNVLFDAGFLQQLMNYSGMLKEFEKAFAGNYDFYGNFQPQYIDTLYLSKLAFAGDDSLSSYKLELIAGHMGIDMEDAHDAGADIEATIDIIRRLSLRMRNRQDSAEAVGREKARNYFKI